MGQATRSQRLASSTADEFPDAHRVAQLTADTPAGVASLADPGRDAVRAANRHAAPDGGAQSDGHVHRRAADPDAHPIGDRVGDDALTVLP